MKELLFKSAKFTAIIAAIGQLAISQIHIGIITKVFEPSIGFFLFLFITFGVVMAFNSTSFRAESNPVLFLFGGIASSGTGLIYLNMLNADIRAENLLTFADARVSIFVSIAVITIYIASTIIMLSTRNYDVR